MEERLFGGVLADVNLGLFNPFHVLGVKPEKWFEHQ
jgi:hypothetical protein